MRLGWTAYSSLRRDLIAPIGSVDQYYPALLDLRALSGEPVHWLPLKCLDPWCHVPSKNALPDEVEVHDSVVHYCDNFQPLMSYVNHAPAEGRSQWLWDNPPPSELFRYEVPWLDVLILECTGQMGGAYGVNEVAKLCWRRNPNLGLLLIDQDLTATTVVSKLKKWLPDWEERVVVATYHFYRKFPQQVVSIIPHLDYLELEPSFDHDYLDCAYVGNDYKRREPMLRFFTHERFHHYGRVKDDFLPDLQAAGGTLHGPFTPTVDYTLEQLYQYHGAGLNIARVDAYFRQLITGRFSEVLRGGAVAFSDALLRSARPIVTDWFLVEDGAELLAKLDHLTSPEGRGLWQDSFHYQRQAVRNYLHRERYVGALWQAAQRLAAGPICGRWSRCAYNDLLFYAGLPAWEEEGD